VKCPSCGYLESKVSDSRMTDENTAVRRRRQCIDCGYRFTTYEKVEEPAVFVIKKDKRRERFNREKVQEGIEKACEKRPISREQIDKVIREMERELKNSPEREVSSLDVGKKIMEALMNLDHVAYVRFASVYKTFEDIGGFQKILESLAEKQGAQSQREKEPDVGPEKKESKK
jgi:transcriptional repressor NrdR